MIDDTKVQELISRYIDGEATPEEKQIVERYIADSKKWKKYYQELRRLDHLLNKHPVAETTPDWERQIYDHLAQESQKEDQAMKKSTFFKVGLGGSIFATIIIALFVFQIYAQRSLQGRIRDASEYISGKSTVPRKRIAKSQDLYEPYYLETDYKTTKLSKSKEPVLAEEQEYWGGDAPETKQLIRTDDRDEVFNTEEYARIYENKFLTVRENPLSTFSIDVDTASYSNVRRYLNQNQLPPPDAVRIEELINYFTYHYPRPEGDKPFSITVDGGLCPWNNRHKLVRIGLQGKTLEEGEIPPSNLVFLIDVSGSMEDANKLPLLKKAFKMMVRQLRHDQRVAIVVYAGAAGQVLDSTPGSNKQAILSAIDHLEAGGSTAGGAGIRLAYKIAQEHLIPEGNNRIILATDGDFNIGTSSTAEMTRLIEEKREQGIFLTVLGFGMGNYKDHRLEQIADKGNGTYYYIDTEREAQKVLVDELGSTLFTIAKDVKIQIEFNPAQVKAYRLIGYENRLLPKEDFHDDTKDAGELGAGHTVTALYELVPANAEETFNTVDELKYQTSQTIPSADLLTVKLRYKQPNSSRSQLISQTITQSELDGSLADDLRFASAVAEFGLLLRQSQHRGDASYERVLTNAVATQGSDPFGYRQEFIDLVRKAQRLDHRQQPIQRDPIQGEESRRILFKGE